MKKAVTLAAIAGLSLASDFEDTEFMTMPFKSTQPLLHNTQPLFHDDDLFGANQKSESRSKLSIFNKRKGETTERVEADDELMTVMEYLKTQPKVVSIPERQILDVRTRIPIVSVLPAEQPKAEEEEEEENPNKPKRSNFSIFDRKEGEKTDEENHHGKSATRSNFSILNRKHTGSYDVQHAKRDLEALVSKLLRHKYAKSDNDLFGLRDVKRGGDKANVLKLDSEEDNDLYGLRDWKRGDSGKAGVLGLDSEEDNDLYGMKDWRREKDSGRAGVLGLDSEEDNDLYGIRDWKRGDKDSGKAGVLGLDSEEDNDLYGLRDWKRGDSGKAGVLGLDDEGDNEFRVLGNLIHDGLEIYRDVKNKDYGKMVSHGIKAAQDVHELTRKSNFLGN